MEKLKQELNDVQSQAIQDVVDYIENYYYTSYWTVEKIRENILILSFPEEMDEYIITISQGKPLATLIGSDDNQITIHQL